MEVEAKWTLATSVTPNEIETLPWSPYTLAQPKTIDQHDTFFDTADQALYQSKHVVRVRRANDDLFVTLKGPGTIARGVHSRPEWEVPTSSEDPQHWPNEIRAMLQELVGDQPLMPLFAVHNFRRTWILLRDGLPVGEVALDQGTIEAGDRQLPMHELEIELKGGAIDDLDALATMITQHLPAHPEDQSKSARGFALLTRSAA